MIRLSSLFILVAFLACAPAKTLKYKSTHTPSSREGIYYFVKKGDSLWRISKKYGVSVKEIMRKNRIYSPHNLKIGSKILIPRRYASRGRTNANFAWPVNGEIINFFLLQLGQKKGVYACVNP